MYTLFWKFSITENFTHNKSNTKHQVRSTKLRLEPLTLFVLRHNTKVKLNKKLIHLKWIIKNKGVK